jgi:LAO/AO transport system kinase
MPPPPSQPAGDDGSAPGATPTTPAARAPLAAFAGSPRARQVLAGDRGAIARLMRDLDDDVAGAAEDLAWLYPHTGRAFIVGVTGMPGVGKSTLVSALIGRYRGADAQVGVVAVDPSSPFSGGALLGDRVRMQQHATDDGVFIRSLATRGQLGGLSRSTADVVAVLDAAGFGRVVIETVGVGQAEVDVMTAADVVVVVSAPGLGDEVQALKAGILEIADVLVVNKADREGAGRAVRDLTTMLQLARRTGAARDASDAAVPVLETVATAGTGVADLVEVIDRVLPAVSERRAARRHRQAHAQLLAIAGELAHRRLLELTGTPEAPGALGRLVDEVAARRRDPRSAAEELLASLDKP